MLYIVKGFLQRRGTDATSACIMLSRRWYKITETEDDVEGHKKSMLRFSKAQKDFGHLFHLSKNELVYKVIKMQRQVDCYNLMKSTSQIDGTDKVRIEHPSAEDIIDQREHKRRRVAFKVAYLGWDYMAYAWSDRNDRTVKGNTNTVERVFLEALVRQQLSFGFGRVTNLDRCGRTDSEVSASSQVICANVRSNLDEGHGVMKRKLSDPKNDVMEQSEQASSTAEDSSPKEDYVPNHLRFSVKDRSKDGEEIPYVSLLNEALPPDIRVLAWSPVSTNFSPRRACIGRTYRYFFPRGRLNIDLMNEAAQKLIGTHSFQNFAKLSSENMKQTFTRQLTKFNIEPLKPSSDPYLPGFDICSATITGSGFAYRQVRLMMAVLLAIGNGSEDPSIIDDLLNTEKVPSRPSYSALPAIPLVFYDNEFKDDEVNWRWDTDALNKTADIMKDIWSHNAMKREVIRAIYGAAVKPLNLEERIDLQDSVLTDFIERNFAMIGKKILEMDRSKTKSEFHEREVQRATRKLKRKGRYCDARDVHEGTSDTFVGWSSSFTWKSATPKN